MNTQAVQAYSKTLLIVEDEIIIADDIASTAVKHGYNVLEPVFDYTAAVLAFNSHTPDLVILDIRLRGGRTGVEFASWIRERYRTPIIYLSVYDSKAIRQLVQSTFPFTYLSKPFLNRDLVLAIKQALNT